MYCDRNSLLPTIMVIMLALGMRIVMVKMATKHANLGANGSHEASGSTDELLLL